MVVNKKWVQQELDKLGLGKCLLLNDKLGELLDIVSRSPNISGKVHIADVKDAEITIRTEGDSAAFLTIAPARGGSPR